MSKKSKTSKTPSKKAASKGSTKTRVRAKAPKSVRRAKDVGPKITDAAKVGAQVAAEAQASPNTTTPTVDAGGGSMVDVTTPAQPSTVKKTPKTPKAPKVNKVSGLDAAALVLKDKAVAMNAKDIVAEIFARGLWTSNGKTPAATLASAMLREIDNKPGKSRFAKTGPGLFALAQA